MAKSLNQGEFMKTVVEVWEYARDGETLQETREFDTEQEARIWSFDFNAHNCIDDYTDRQWMLKAVVKRS